MICQRTNGDRRPPISIGVLSHTISLLSTHLIRFHYQMRENIRLPRWSSGTYPSPASDPSPPSYRIPSHSSWLVVCFSGTTKREKARRMKHESKFAEGRRTETAKGKSRKEKGEWGERRRGIEKCEREKSRGLLSLDGTP